jgi:hypothetical protein
MSAFACPRWSRMLVGASAVLVVVAAAAAVALEDAGASPRKERLAARLLRLDPGGLVGGNTQVATPAGARLVGVPGRANFILGLGRRQLILGGRGHDQLGARGAAGRIVGGHGRDLIHGGKGHDQLVGGKGHDLIHGNAGHDAVDGGRDHDLVRGGQGHDELEGGHGHDVIQGGHGHDRLEGGHGDDRLIDRQGDTVVVTGPGTNHVDVADEGNDRIHCHPDSTNNIVVDRDDRLHPRCDDSDASTVRYVAPQSETPTAHTAQQTARSAQQSPITGDGSSDNPFTAPCDDATQDPCVGSGHRARSLDGLWDGENVPAYKCPPSHPYLIDQDYAPFGTALPAGVEVVGLGPIGVSISGVKTSGGWAIGTLTGFPNSSATSWSFGTNSYRVQLHCARTTTNSYWYAGRP